MGGLIILVLLALVGVFISRAAKVYQKQTSGKHFDENFPFPSVLDVQENKPFDPWDMTSRGDLSSTAPIADEIVVEEVKPTTYRPIESSMLNTEPTEPIKEDKPIEFDLRQAVIYSEILKPKFMEQ